MLVNCQCIKSYYTFTNINNITNTDTKNGLVNKKVVNMEQNTEREVEWDFYMKVIFAWFCIIGAFF